MNDLWTEYSCIKNMEHLIKFRNMQLLRKHHETQEPATRQSNCRSRNSCPLDGKCMSKSAVYMATLRTENEEYHYIGMTEGTFKQRAHVVISPGAVPKQNQTVGEDLFLQRPWARIQDWMDHSQTWTRIQSRPEQLRSVYVGETRNFTSILWPHLLNYRTEILPLCRHKRKNLL